MTSKERAELKTKAMKLDSIFQIGKSSLTPQLIDAIKDALLARELIKLNVLKNCMDDPHELAETVAQRTGSQVVQVIGKKIVLYKKNPQKEEKRKRAAKQQKAAMQLKTAKKNGSAPAQKKPSGQKAWTRADSLQKKRENRKSRGKR